MADLGVMYYLLRGKAFKVFSGKANLLCPSPSINTLILGQSETSAFYKPSFFVDKLFINNT